MQYQSSEVRDGDRSGECRTIAPWLPGLPDGDLEAARRSAMEAHLEGCPACRHDAEALLATSRLVRDAPLPGAGLALAEGAEVARRIIEREAERARPWERSFGLAPARNGVLAVVGAAVAAALMISLPRLRPEPPPAQEAIVRSQPAAAPPVLLVVDDEESGRRVLLTPSPAYAYAGGGGGKP